MEIPINKKTSGAMMRPSIDLTKVTQSIIANEIAMHFQNDIRLTNYFKGRLKNKLNGLNQELKKVSEKEFEKMFLDNGEEKADIAGLLYNAQSEMIKELADLGIMHFGNIKEIIKAYKKDPKSIEGIVNKINR